MSDSGNIRINILDGRRQHIPDSTQVLVRLLNGAVPIPSKWASGGDITVQGIPFANNGNDAYNVFAHINGFQDAVTPNRVPVIRGGTTPVSLLAIPDDGQFHFLPWNELQQIDPRILKLVTMGAAGDPATRYAGTVEAHPMELGALLNLATAIRDIPLDDGTTPLDHYYWQVIWEMLAPDRFWAWVDARLAARIKALADLHAFAPEDNPGFWHPACVVPGTGLAISAATRSWKQTRFDVTNVQLTFHEDTRQVFSDANGNPVECVVIEPDIDLYKDLLAHGLIEVLPNALTNGKTDPRAVYAMRWMATRQEQGVAPFDPPVTIE